MRFNVVLLFSLERENDIKRVSTDNFSADALVQYVALLVNIHILINTLLYTIVVLIIGYIFIVLIFLNVYMRGSLQ